MKKYFNKISLIIASLAIITVTGCEKDGIVDRSEKAAGANVKFYNLSVGAPSVNFFANNVKITSFAPTTAGAVTGLAFGLGYPLGTNYLNVTPGSTQLSAIIPASSTVRPNETLVSPTVNFKDKAYYSVFVVDPVASVSTLVLEDDLTLPDPTKGYVRFVNLAAGETFNVTDSIAIDPSAPVLKYKLNKTVFSGIAYKNVGEFAALDAGKHKLVFTPAVGSTSLPISITGSIDPSKKTTLYIYGVMDSKTKLYPSGSTSNL